MTRAAFALGALEHNLRRLRIDEITIGALECSLRGHKLSERRHAALIVKWSDEIREHGTPEQIESMIAMTIEARGQL